MTHPYIARTLMRAGFVVSLALVSMAPPSVAAEFEMTVYLHEGPLHALPEEIRADVGDVLKLTIMNPEAPGKGPHNFLVCGDGKKFSESCTDRWGFTGMIQPGESAPLTVTMEKAGTFEYYCFIAGHKAGGMSGDLIVQEARGEKKGLPMGPLALLALAGLAIITRRRAP